MKTYQSNSDYIDTAGNRGAQLVIGDIRQKQIEKQAGTAGLDIKMWR